MRSGLQSLPFVALLAALPVVAGAQIYYRPQPPPMVTAESEQWFQLGEPITFEGNFYYPAGPRVYFDGNVMMRTGAYRGVPLYANTTLEPYSKVFVPLSGGLMQPYERRRTGDMAGSTGSQAPSFPVTIAGERSREEAVRPSLPASPGPPVFSQPSELELEARMADEAEAARRASRPAAPLVRPAGAVTGTGGATLPAPRDVIEAGTKPKGLNEIYVSYAGYRWRASGMAVSLDETRYEKIGEYHGFAVYAERGERRNDRVIYLPSRDGLLAPYERAGLPVQY